MVKFVPDVYSGDWQQSVRPQLPLVTSDPSFQQHRWPQEEIHRVRTVSVVENKDVGLIAGTGTGNCNYKMSVSSTDFFNPKKTEIPSSLCVTGSKTDSCQDWIWNNSVGRKVRCERQGKNTEGKPVGFIVMSVCAVIHTRVETSSNSPFTCILVFTCVHMNSNLLQYILVPYQTGRW